MKKYNFYVYIITNKKDGVLYIGVTNNISRRIYEHKNKLFEGFSSKYKLTKLVYCEKFQYVEDAIIREKQLKAWKRQWKINLINESNEEWKDLDDAFMID